MHNAVGARRGCGYEARIFGPGNQRFFAENVDIGLQRARDEHRVAARGRADIDEVQRFIGQEIV
jgi:hypothetical protein